MSLDNLSRGAKEKREEKSKEEESKGDFIVPSLNDKLFLGLLPRGIQRHGLVLLGMTTAVYHYAYLFQLVIDS